MLNFFGTDGIRGHVGSGIFIEDKLIKTGAAIGRWLIDTYGPYPKIFITTDTRISADPIKDSLKKGFLQHPLIISDTGILPTPAMAHLLQAYPDFHCALIISASHNPYQDNGIKIIKQTGKLTLDDELSISRYMQEAFIINTIPSMSLVGTDILNTESHQKYIECTIQHIPHLSLTGKKIVLDTANGATFRAASKIFAYFDAEIIHIHNEPNGYNINQGCGALHLESLIHTVISHQADIGFAFDGDGDRVIAVNHRGIVKDGDDILALLIKHPSYHDTPNIVGTIMSNEGLAQFLQHHQKTLLRTAVGDKYIAEKLMLDSLMLGGEPSGHIILNDIINTGDGILVALKILEVLCHTNNWDMHTFDKYPQAVATIPIITKHNLQEKPFSTIISQAQAELSTGRILVRYSGTENVLRIMVEAQNRSCATTFCSRLVQQLSPSL